jgi:hypothetical protein
MGQIKGPTAAPAAGRESPLMTADELAEVAALLAADVRVRPGVPRAAGRDAGRAAPVLHARSRARVPATRDRAAPKISDVTSRAAAQKWAHEREPWLFLHGHEEEEESAEVLVKGRPFCSPCRGRPAGVIGARRGEHFGTAIVIAVLTGKSIGMPDLTVGSRDQATTLAAFTRRRPGVGFR